MYQNGQCQKCIVPAQHTPVRTWSFLNRFKLSGETFKCTNISGKRYNVSDFSFTQCMEQACMWLCSDNNIKGAISQMCSIFVSLRSCCIGSLKHRDIFRVTCLLSVLCGYAGLGEFTSDVHWKCITNMYVSIHKHFVSPYKRIK